LLTRRDMMRGAAAAFLAPAVSPAKAAAAPALLITHSAFTGHQPGILNPERPERMQAIDRALGTPEFGSLQRCDAPLRDDIEEAILRVHSREYYTKLQSAHAAGRFPHNFDSDTIMSAGTWEAALRGAGAGLLAVDTVLDPASGIRNAFCQIRPPGHHAAAARAMGFCLFSNAAIAAFHARARHGAARVAVADFDLHHGNGTQSLFWTDKNLFYGSTHQMPLFPGTGAVSETGSGNIFNAPLMAGDDGAVFREAMNTRILPALDAFRPDLIIISAGFDAHEGDPLGNLRLREADFAWITERLMVIAARHCAGRIVSMLEGGYRPGALGRSAAAHVKTLMGA
jgi:acetoin utilization deacetylase AcuC-like enzyme